MHQREQFGLIFVYIYFNLLYSLDLCDTINLTELEYDIFKHIVQINIDPVALQQKAYLYYEELLTRQRLIKYNDSKAISEVKYILDKGGPVYLNYSLNTNVFENNEWSSFEILVFDDIISATKDAWDKCIESIEYLHKNNSNVDGSFEFISNQIDNYVQPQYENTELNVRLPDILKDTENIVKFKETLHMKKDDNTLKINVLDHKSLNGLYTDSERLRQVNIEKMKRQIKHNEMKRIANIKKAEKQRKHLERMEQRQMMKERKAKRLEKHRLHMKLIEKKKKVMMNRNSLQKSPSYN